MVTRVNWILCQSWPGSYKHECQFKNWIWGFDFCFSFLHFTDSWCLIATALCQGETQTKANAPLFDLMLFPALTCLLSIDVHTMHRESSSTAAAHLSHIYSMQASVLTRTKTHTHADCVFHSLFFIRPFFPPCTHMSRDSVFFSVSPSSRSGFKLYYFPLVDSFPWGVSKNEKEKTTSLSKTASSTTNWEQGVLGSLWEYEHILDPFDTAQTIRPYSSAQMLRNNGQTITHNKK